jgi:hypothetical protein
MWAISRYEKPPMWASTKRVAVGNRQHQCRPPDFLEQRLPHRRGVLFPEAVGEEGAVQILETRAGELTGLPASVAEEDRPENREHPRPGGLGMSELVEGLERPHARLLDQILGIRGRAG